MYNSQTTDTVLQSSQLLRSWLLGNTKLPHWSWLLGNTKLPHWSWLLGNTKLPHWSWLLGNQMKDRATTLVIIAGKPEEAQSYHIGHGCWATRRSTKLSHCPWSLGKQKKHKATIVLLYDKPAQQPQVFKEPD